MGGEYRFGLHHNRGVANVYTWTSVDGEIVDRRVAHDLPLPETPLLESNLAGVTFETIEPLTKYRIRMCHGELTADFVWTAFMPPVAMSLNHAGAKMAAGHYNTIGRAIGAGTYKGHAFTINGDGFHDHSWGRRKEQLPGSRFCVAVFDPEFFFLAMPVLGDDDRTTMLGYVAADGRLRRLANDYEMGYTMRDDWITPASCDARLFDEDGRGFRLLGRTVGPSSWQPFPQGKFVTHAKAEFECGGRLGRGILESTAPRYLSSAQLAAIGLPGDHFLNAPFAE